jgi:hypothetical protein
MSKEMLRGSDAMLFVNAKTVALATSCNVEVTTNTIEGRTKDSAHGPDPEFDYVAFTASSENFVGINGDGYNQQTAADLLDLQLAGTKVRLAFGVVARTSDAIPEGGWTSTMAAQNSYLKIYEGEAWIKSVSLTNPNDAKSTITVNFEGVGPLRVVDTITDNA